MILSPKRLVDLLLGLEMMQPISAFIARMGMRGAGIGLSFRLDESGEARMLSRIGARNPGFSCLDVGGNAGRYALAALDSGASRVVAFEPVPKTFEIIKTNTAGSAIELHNVAVGEAEKVTVPMIAIDDFCYENEFFPTLIKIDVEGFEREVMLGAKKLLADDRGPTFVQFEFNLHHLYRGHTMKEFEALLPGYHLFRSTASGLSPIGAYRGMDTIYGYMNILACRDEKPFS